MTEYKTKNKKIEDYMKIRAEIDSCLYNLAKEIPYEKLKKSFNLILLILQNAFIGKDKKKRSLKKSNSKIQNLLVFENFKRLIKILGFVEQSDEIILNTKNQNKFCDFGAYSIEYIKQINIENFIEQKVTTPNLVEREIKLITKAKTQKTEANPNSETDSDSETEKALLIQSFERKKAEFSNRFRRKQHKKEVKFDKTLIAIDFGFNIILKAYFSPKEKFIEVYKLLIEEVLNEDFVRKYNFVLSMSGRKEMDKDKTFEDLDIVPCGKFWLNYKKDLDFDGKSGNEDKSKLKIDFLVDKKYLKLLDRRGDSEIPEPLDFEEMSFDKETKSFDKIDAIADKFFAD